MKLEKQRLPPNYIRDPVINLTSDASTSQPAPSLPTPLPQTPSAVRLIIKPRNKLSTAKKVLTFTPESANRPTPTIPIPTATSTAAIPTTSTKSDLAKAALQMALDRIQNLNPNITDTIFATKLIMLHLKLNDKENENKTQEEIISTFISDLVSI
jgi:hypothetical protein